MNDFSTRSNYRQCPVPGCQVEVFDIEHDLSGIGDDMHSSEQEVGTDNEYDCQNCEHPECLCRQYDLG